MRTFEQQPKETQLPTPAQSRPPERAHGGPHRAWSSMLHLQRTIGNRAVERLAEVHSVGRKVGEDDKPVATVPPPTVEPKPEPEPGPGPQTHEPLDAPPKPAPPTITSETDFAAPDGSAKTRTDVGIGEIVTFTGSASGKWTATTGKPVTLASGATFKWTAPDRAADVTIKLEVGTQSANLVMKVLEPATITGVRNSVIAIGAGTAGAGMKLTFNYGPKKVSFGNVMAREVSGPASNITGYFKKFYTADQLKHDSGDTYTAVKENNEDSAEDTAKSTDTFKPYEEGTFDWVIPNRFKVKTEAGDGKEFPSKVTQAFHIDAVGTEKITKATASVERKVTEP
jgi:hypothetical protein